MIELLIATKNRGKLKEIESLFADCSSSVTLYCLSDFNINDDCHENGSTFHENAVVKSLFYGAFIPGLYTVGDDSGLMVEALNGAPGVYSARFAGIDAEDDQNTTKLLEQLKGAENRNAKFVTAACLSTNNKVIASFIGEVGGIIIDEKQGFNGFGYDPVFYYPPLKKTFAELSAEEKNRISHRAIAFQQIKDYLLA